MSIFKAATQFLTDTAKVAGQIGGETLKYTGDALNDSTKFVGKHQDDIASKTRNAVGAGATAVRRAGETIASKAEMISRDIKTSAPQSDQRGQKLLRAIGGLTADAVSVAGRAAGKMGTFTENAAPAIGGATGSAIMGLFGTVSGAVDSVAISERHFDDLRQRLNRASLAYKLGADETNRRISEAQLSRRKRDLLDLLVIGGVTLSDIVADPASTPADVERAFELAYPGLAGAGEHFSDVVDRVPADDLLGLVSGVKGKLFELQLVDHLNADILTDGQHAVLATSATQPGWDIQILDGHGHLIDVLQAKATESVGYVREALERYPDIDVSTTSEVYSQLMAHGIAGHISDSGISEHALQQHVEAAIHAEQHFDISDIGPSSLGLAVIGLSAFMDKSLTLEERGVEFGDRAAKASVTGAAAKAALLTTNTWWLALIVGVGSRMLTSVGGNKRQRYEALEQAVLSLEAKVIAGGLILPNMPRMTT